MYFKTSMVKHSHFVVIYKLIEVEACQHIQAIVDEHYKRYFDKEEYMREAANMNKTIPQMKLFQVNITFI